MQDKTKICLTIICKDESKVIKRMLDSVYPILDAYCVVDTGSTDNTVEIVEEFFKEKSIPGEVVQIPWVDFCTSRNKAIEEGIRITQNLGFENTHFFWIDCDETLILDPKFSPDKFKENIATFDGANVNVSYGNSAYYRQQFYRSSSEWRWYGPVHEVLVTDKKDIKIPIVEGLTVSVRADGNSWSDSIQKKYEGHAKILEDYVQKNPDDPRWFFYLAQSYREAGGEENLKKSLQWYEKRAKMTNGYWEEIYFSLLMCAGLKAQLGYPLLEILESYRKCTGANRGRIEHIIPIILHYQSQKDWDTAYIYSSYIMEFAGNKPKNCALFINVDDYFWRAYELHSLSCWYSGRKEEGIKWFRKLWKQVERGLVPSTEIERIRANKKYFLK